jgi:hypothetical protein
MNRQYDMQQIITNETGRLNQKKQLIDNAMQGQVRMVSLNETYRQRNTQYRQLIIYSCAALAIFIAMVYLKRTFPVIPDWAITIVTIILISVFIIYSVILFRDIMRRNNMYFDQLNLAPPANFGANNSGNTTNQNDLLSQMSITCIGQTCCSGNTIWDPVNSVCLVPPTN